MLIVLERKGSFNLIYDFIYEVTVSLCWNSSEVIELVASITSPVFTSGT